MFKYRKIFILARTYKQAKYMAYENGIAERDFIYPDSADSIHGHHNPLFICLEGWHWNEKMQKSFRMLQACRGENILHKIRGLDA